jgi:hypothetical protein
MTRLRMHSAFVFWGGRAGGGSRDFFSLVPNVLLSYAHQAPTRFPKGPASSQFVPNSTSILSHSKLHSHVHKLKSWGHIWFYLVTWGPKRCFYWGVPDVPKYWRWVNQSGPFQKIFVLGLSMLLSPPVSRASDSNGPSRNWQVDNWLNVYTFFNLQLWHPSYATLAISLYKSKLHAPPFQLQSPPDSSSYTAFLCLSDPFVLN